VLVSHMQMLLADDHELLRDGMRQVLYAMEEPLIIHEAGSLPEVFDALKAFPDIALILMDLCMPGMDGVYSLVSVRQAAPAASLVVISAKEDIQTIQAAMQTGASGYIPKSSPASIILSAIRLVLDGGIYLPPQLSAYMQLRRETADLLTGRQIEVLSLLAEGLSNKSIAHKLDITEGTVKQHTHAIFEHLGLTNRTQAVLKACEMGLISIE